jgi:hypothetical protein
MISLACLFRRMRSHNHQRRSRACHYFTRQFKSSSSRQCRSHNRLPSAGFSRRTTTSTKTVNSFLSVRDASLFFISNRCRSHTEYLDILRTYMLGPSTLRSRIDDLYQSVHREQVHFPPIRNAEHPRRVPTI